MTGRPPPDRGRPRRGVAAALDELRFGSRGTLNLREGLPSAAEARTRAENFLREHQVHGTREVLIITGRGNLSDGGVPVIREAIERLLFSLRRRGVIAGHHAHNPGAFTVTLAPIRSMVDAPPRRREPPARHPRVAIHGLDDEAATLLRELAECALHALGVTPDDRTLEAEMHRQLAGVLGGVRDGSDREERLRQALRTAIAEYD